MSGYSSARQLQWTPLVALAVNDSTLSFLKTLRVMEGQQLLHIHPVRTDPIWCQGPERAAVVAELLSYGSDG